MEYTGYGKIAAIHGGLEGQDRCDDRHGPDDAYGASRGLGLCLGGQARVLRFQRVRVSIL